MQTLICFHWEGFCERYKTKGGISSDNHEATDAATYEATDAATYAATRAATYEATDDATYAALS